MIHRITSLRKKRQRPELSHSGVWCFCVTELSSAFCFPCWTGFLFLRADEWSQNHIIVVIHVIDTNKNTAEMNKTWFWLLWYQLLFGRYFVLLILFIFNQAWWLMVQCCYQVLQQPWVAWLASSIHELQMCCLTKLKTKNIRISPKFKGRLGHAIAPLQRHQQCNCMGHCY